MQVTNTAAFNMPPIHILQSLGLRKPATRETIMAKIDKLAFGGMGIRPLINIRVKEETAWTSCLDLACGTGQSTPWGAVGVDIDNDKIYSAKFAPKTRRTFVTGDARSFGKSMSFDVTTIFFALPGLPRADRLAIMANGLRLATKCMYVVDIAPSHPGIVDSDLGATMTDIEVDLTKTGEEAGFSIECIDVLPLRVCVWRLERMRNRTTNKTTALTSQNKCKSVGLGVGLGI
jgi:SAM-dependent methyltransferase